MPNSKAVAQYLPFLRRYARALTGSQMSGDAYVGATLEALIADPAIISDVGGPRVALYRLFTKLQTKGNIVLVKQVAQPFRHAERAGKQYDLITLPERCPHTIGHILHTAVPFRNGLGVDEEMR